MLAASPPRHILNTMSCPAGGSWDEGAASYFLYNATADIVATEDVIIIASNYRLNAFGFLAGTALKEQNGDGTVGNYGIQVSCGAVAADVTSRNADV